MLAAALELIAAGYRIFPVKPLDKCPPLIKGWPEHATSSRDMVRLWWHRWPTANVATLTGEGWAVVDVDPRNGGALAAVEALGLPLDTRSLTTPGGGWQLHYRVDAPVTSRSCALGPGLDVKAERAYVLLPPSVRTDGSYTWLHDGLSTQRHTVDAAVLNRTSGTRSTGTQQRPRVERRRPEDVLEGERHDQVVRWAAWFCAAGYEPAEVESLVWQFNERLGEPLPDKEVLAILDWVARKEEAVA